MTLRFFPEYWVFQERLVKRGCPTSIIAALVSPPVLWQYNFSNFNEKARWALDFKRVSHVRRSLLPGGPRAIAYSLRGTLPVLDLDGERIVDSTRIIAALERRFPQPALYPDESAGGSACLRGARPHGCLVEPIWIWTALRPWPRLPSACRTPHGVRVAPLDAQHEREPERYHRMLAHPATTLGKEQDPRLLNTCPRPTRTRVIIDGASYAVYAVDAPAGSRWYRFSLERGPALVPLGDCERG